MTRNYSSTVPEMTLAADINISVTTITLNGAANLPSRPYTLVINPNTTIEEIVTVVLDQSGIIFPSVRVLRGQDGTTANNHTNNNKVRHMITARDLQEPQDHMDLTSAHLAAGVTGNVVGTGGPQTLTNKTLTSPVINTPTITSPTISDAAFSGSISGITSTTVGLANVTNTSDAAKPVSTLQQTAINARLSKVITIIAAKTSAYTLVLTDEAAMLELNGTFSVTVPPDSSVNFPIGAQINFVNINTGVITFAPSGVTLNGTPGLKLRTQWSCGTLIKRASNNWLLVGDLAP